MGTGNKNNGKNGKVVRIVLWEEAGTAKYSTKLQEQDTIEFRKDEGNLLYFRPSEGRRLLVYDDNKQYVGSIGTFWEIVYNVAATTGLGYVITENTDRRVKVQFVDHH